MNERCKYMEAATSILFAELSPGERPLGNRSLFLGNPRWKFFFSPNPLRPSTCKSWPFTLLWCCNSNRDTGKVFMEITALLCGPWNVPEEHGWVVPHGFFPPWSLLLDLIPLVAEFLVLTNHWGHCGPASPTYANSIAISYTWKTSM